MTLASPFAAAVLAIVTLSLLGLPIGLAMGFEGGVFSAAAYLMGLISADAVAAHAVALQIAALSFMVPWGMAQAATVREIQMLSLPITIFQGMGMSTALTVIVVLVVPPVKV